MKLLTALLLFEFDHSVCVLQNAALCLRLWHLTCALLNCCKCVATLHSAGSETPGQEGMFPWVRCVATRWCMRAAVQHGGDNKLQLCILPTCTASCLRNHILLGRRAAVAAAARMPLRPLSKPTSFAAPLVRSTISFCACLNPCSGPARPQPAGPHPPARYGAPKSLQGQPDICQLSRRPQHCRSASGGA